MAEINQNMNYIDLLNALRKRANLNNAEEVTVKSMTMILKLDLENASAEIYNLEGDETLAEALLNGAAGSVV